MRPLPPHLLPQPHHHRLRHDQAPRPPQIRAQSRLVHHQPAEHEVHLAQRAHAQHETLRHDRPLEVPGPAGALKVRDQGVEGEAGVGAQHLGGGDDELGGDGVAFLGHGGAGAAVGDEGFAEFGELGAGHDDGVGGGFGEGAADEGEEGDGLGDGVARDVPCYQGRWGEGEFGGELFQDAESRGAQAGEGAGGAAQLGGEDAGAELGEAAAVGEDGGEGDGEFVAEGDGERVLHVGAAGHGGVAVPLGEAGEGGRELDEFALDQVEPGLDLEDGGGVHDVLRRGAPVDVFRGVFRRHLVQLLD